MVSKSTRGKAQELIELIHRSKLKAPQTIVFGRGRLDELGDLVFPLAWGQKALVVVGARSARQSGLEDRVHTLLTRYTVQGVTAPAVTREPTIEMVDAMTVIARELKPKLIVSAGGGSVIDCAKAVAALAVNEGPVEDYLEGVGKGLPVANQPLPHIAIPTVPGTGAEMTKNAVIACHEKHYKRSVRADSMIPTVALVDPLLTLTVPQHITASGGMDAITQLIESCISVKRRPEVTLLALEGLRVARQALSLCYEDPANVPAREQMSLVSMLSGACLANAGLAMAHGIAAALGAIHEVPHGLACGILLPHTLRHNQSACSAELAQVLAAFLNQERPGPTTIRDGIAAIENLNQWLQIPPDLKYLRLSGKDVEQLAEASAGTSMAGNPVPMTAESTYAFLKTIA